MSHSPAMHVRTIKAAVLRRKGGPLKIESLEMEGPREDEVLVRLVASGICHTDIDCCDTWETGEAPVILGHEGAGVVEEVGNRVRGVRSGDRVVLSYQSCGRCAQCRSGRPTQCELFWEANFGFQRLDGSNALAKSGVRCHFFGQSSFSTHLLATVRNLVHVPDDLSLEMLAPLGCGIQTGAGTVMNSLKISKGQSLAVFGTGAVGLAVIMAARVVGADPIVGVDLNRKRLEIALELGATHVIDNRHDDVKSNIVEITGSGLNYVVETTGDWNMHKVALDVLNPQGTVALMTGDAGSDKMTGRRKSISIIQGDAVPQLFIPKLIELYREGRFAFDRLERFYHFDDINEAIADAKSGKTIKPVLRIGQE